MNAADWLATDEGHAWLDSTFPHPLRTGGFYQIKDDEDAYEAVSSEAQWLSDDGEPAVPAP